MVSNFPQASTLARAALCVSPVMDWRPAQGVRHLPHTLCFTRLCFFQSRFTHRLERCSLDLSDVTHVCVSAACLSKLRTCPHGASE